MAYFDAFNKDIWYKLGLSYDILKPYPLFESDVERSILIADEIINNYEERIYLPSENISFSTVLHNTSKVYVNLGFYSLAKKAVSLLNNVQYLINEGYKDERITVQSMIVNTGVSVCKHPYLIEIPKMFTDISIHFMVHEVAHMLKESNPRECKGIYSDTEVIPMLLEMISAYKAGDDNAFKKRELLMLEIAKNFKDLHDDRINNRIQPDERIAFNACYRQNVLYLNSFYYSLVLFGMYLNSPLYVLGIIEDVLSHKFTTGDVVNSLLTCNDFNYESGLDEFRIRLK